MNHHIVVHVRQMNIALVHKSLITHDVPVNIKGSSSLFVQVECIFNRSTSPKPMNLKTLWKDRLDLES